MKIIPLSITGKKHKGKHFALIDEKDYERVNKHNWHLSIGGKNNKYAKGFVNGKAIFLHRFLLNVYDTKKQIDHINGDGLDNRDGNLRIATHSENQKNRKKINGTSKYLGVFHLKIIKKNKMGEARTYEYWIANISSNCKNQYLGCFKTESGAAQAYNEAAKKYHGEFANLNIVE